MFNSGFFGTLDEAMLSELRRRALRSRAASLTATTVANSGHPGGSLSSMEIYTLLYSLARLDPERPRWPGRDRIVVSHGHTSPGVYSALAAAGFFPIEEVEAHFRQTGCVFEGHVERSVPGIEWSSGNLGQGLSAGVGLAIGARLTGADWHTFVVMSDGEQQKGQVGEARRLAVKEGLAQLTVIIDWNRVQISGHTDQVMPVPLRDDWEADGWSVREVDGHDLESLHAAIVAAVDDGNPSVVLAHTVIGKGVSFMEDDPSYHGKALTAEEYARAMHELGFDPGMLHDARERRSRECTVRPLEHATASVAVASGDVRSYAAGVETDDRSAWGQALADIAAANPDVPMAVFDCDLMESVKTGGFRAVRPEGFIQCGVGEHNAAVASGVLSTVPGVVCFWADFGVFGVDEVYNQQRLNDINGAGLKLVLTHCGLDVGEDGKTHQCLDYIGAFRELYGWKLIVPADPNQTDRAVRAMAGMQGCVAMAMGRSKLPVIVGEDGQPVFAGDYEFRYGEFAWAREGDDATILVTGTPAGSAVAAADALASEGVDVAVGVVACPLHLDDEGMRRAFRAPVLVVEDHNVHSGLGVSVALWSVAHGEGGRIETLGVRDYAASGPAAELLARAGLDRDGIVSAVRSLLA